MPALADWMHGELPRCAREQDNAGGSSASAQEWPATPVETANAIAQAPTSMSDMRRLTRGMGHDLNNLLMVVMASLELLKRRAQLTNQGLQWIEDALSGVERAALLARHMVSFGARESTRTSHNDIENLVRITAKLLAKTFATDIRVETKFERPTVAYCETKQIELALMNLAVDRLGRMPNGATLSIGAYETGVTDNEVPGLRAGRYARIVVTDTGSTPTTEPRKNTDEQRADGGFGLDVVAGIADRAGGLFSTQNGGERGSVMTLWLPSGPRRRSQGRLRLADRGLSVLLVDDDPLVRASIARMLGDLGHHVIEAQSGLAALDTLTRMDTCDLLLSDYAMQGMNGAQLAAEVIRSRPSVKAVLSSGYNGAFEVGTDDAHVWLCKPFDQAQLAAAIDLACASISTR